MINRFMPEIKIADEGLSKLMSEFIFMNDYLDNPNIRETVDGVDCVYVFWWDKDESFKELNTLNLNIAIKGKKNRASENSEDPFLSYETIWEIKPATNGKVCLYVGKTHNLLKRIDLHLCQPFKKSWYEADSSLDNRLLKRTTACQLRSGIEHLYKYKPVDFMSVVRKHICISHYSPVFTDAGEKMQPPEKMKERFYLEDLAIGYLRPLFNLDSER